MISAATEWVLALALGAVLLVEPILVSLLRFALPLAARLDHRRIVPRTWATAAAIPWRP